MSQFDRLFRTALIVYNEASGSGAGLAQCDSVIELNFIAKNSAAYGGGLAFCNPA